MLLGFALGIAITVIIGGLLVFILTSEDDELVDVMQLYTKFGIPFYHVPGLLTQERFSERYIFLLEELDEFKHAVNNNDMALMADALVDLVYVAKGTAAMMGLPWKKLWNDVQRANLSKVKGTTHRNMRHDLVKPKDWKGPQTWKILNAAGFDSSAEARSL